MRTVTYLRRFIPISIVLLLIGIMVLVERRETAARVGLGAVMRIVADFQRESERVPMIATRVSDQEETDIGNSMAAGYLRNRPSTNADVLETENYLERVGRPLTVRVQRKEIRYQFHLEDDPALVNAFALPGGHIVVGRGLLTLMESEDELAAVLGHEIAHVDRRHAIERLQYELAARKLGLSLSYALASLPIGLFHAGYAKELELEADRTGAGLAAAADYSPQAAIDLFGRFQKLFEQSQRRRTTPAGDLRNVALGGLSEYLSSHPPASERISEIEKEIIAHRWKRAAVRPLDQHAVGKTP